MKYELVDNGLLARFERAEARAAIQILRAAGFKYGDGECGRGLYSPTWDRQLGYWYGQTFYLNPSLLHHLPADHSGGA